MPDFSHYSMNIDNFQLVGASARPASTHTSPPVDLANHDLSTALKQLSPLFKDIAPEKITAGLKLMQMRDAMDTVKADFRASMAAGQKEMPAAPPCPPGRER